KCLDGESSERPGTTIIWPCIALTVRVGNMKEERTPSFELEFVGSTPDSYGSDSEEHSCLGLTNLDTRRIACNDGDYVFDRLDDCPLHSAHRLEAREVEVVFYVTIFNAHFRQVDRTWTDHGALESHHRLLRNWSKGSGSDGNWNSSSLGRCFSSPSVSDSF